MSSLHVFVTCSIILFWDKKATGGYSISGYLYGIGTMASVYSDEYQRVINALKKARKEQASLRHFEHLRDRTAGFSVQSIIG